MHPALVTLAPRRIAVVRALMLGDLLCATPALRSFRTAFPDAEITLVGLPWARELAARLPHLLDAVLPLPGWPGLRETPEPNADEVRRFLHAADARGFDLAVQLHGSGDVTNALAAALGARRAAGFVRPGARAPDHELFVPYPDSGPEIRRLLALPRALGLPDAGEELEFPLGPADAEELARVAPGLERGGHACVHPGGRSARRWPPERFAAVADALADRGLEVVLTGSAGEAATTAAVAATMRAPARDLAGRTSLGALGALVDGAALVLANDTGVSHLAAALRVPSVVVVTTSDPDRWAPLDRDRHRVVVRPRGVAPVLAALDALLAAAPA